MIAAPDVDLAVHEVDRICHPLKQRAAKVRYLRQLGLTVRVTRQGDPLVNRQHYNETMCGRPLGAGEADQHGTAANEAAATADIVGLHAWASKRKVRNGSKT